MEQQKPDWVLAQALYIAGHGHGQICEQAGCKLTALRKRIHRGQWVQKRTTAQAVQPQKISMAARSELVRQSLAVDLQQSAEQLRELKRSNNPELAKTRSEVVRDVVSAAKDVFGWDHGNQTTVNIFNLPLIESVRTVEPIEIEATQTTEAS